MWRAVIGGRDKIVGGERWNIPLEAVMPIVLDEPLDGARREHVAALGREVFEKSPYLQELPIVSSAGKIVSVLRKPQLSIETLCWSLFSKEILPKGKIYLASRKNPLLVEFAERWKGKLDIEWLSETNWQQVLKNTSEDMVLLYGADIYPECNKIEIHDLFARCMESFLNPPNQYRSVECYLEPRRTILPKLALPPNEPEMSEFESSFLCGLLRQYRPHKIVEVGLAAGGTSAIILQCLQMTGQSYEMFSVDLSEQFYRGPEHESGYLAEEAKPYLAETHHKRLLGKLALERIPEIGADIDFLILDTTHVLPGEALDFLALLPYLKDGCVVVLHDVALNYFMQPRTSYSDVAYGNKLLFNIVHADVKYLMQDGGSYPNIAAFEVDASTRKHVMDYFSNLTATWFDINMPTEAQVAKYRAWYALHYDEQCLWVFDEAVRMNRAIFSRARQ